MIDVVSGDYGDLLTGLNAGDFEIDEIGEEGSWNDDERVNPEPEELLNDPFITAYPANIAPVSLSAGFSTGAGRALAPPSAASLARIRKIFDDGGEDDVAEVARKAPRLEPSSHSLFTTGSGAAVPPPSKRAMDAAMSLFNETRPVDEAGTHKEAESVEQPTTPLVQSAVPSGPSGFTTGSGLAVPKPSKSSLTRALALFDGSSLPAASTSTPTHPAPSFRPPMQSTPSRTPLRTTTNTFGSPRPTGRAIEIETPAMRRIGLGGTPQSRGKRGFVTPFKRGATPRAVVAGPNQASVSSFERVFDLSPPPDRKTMRQAFLKPQYHSVQEFQDLGIPPEIWLLDLTNAPHYQFYRDEEALGTSQALEQLHRDRCALATSRWAENHWAMILWKLAGQIQAKPSLYKEKWNWTEVIRQLKYRYEREYGAAERPIVRKIHEHDSSPSLPMVLCVTAVHRSTEPQTRPYLELTDGWYRINADVDECLARAVVKGKIAVGRKLSISGAKLDSGSDGSDALDGIGKSKLVVSGNSSALAKWDAKLGVNCLPFVASLSSLSPDGGPVVLLDIMVDKVFSLAYVHGDKSNREPPWDEGEEHIREDRWREKYAAERTRLQEALRKSLEPIEDLFERLASQAEDSIAGCELNPTAFDRTESDFDDLLAVKGASHRLQSMSASQIGHLARYARERLETEVQGGQAQLEADLNTVCPQRDVRSFRMVRAQDAQIGNKEAARVAMLRVWDAKRFEIAEGKRYLVSNLIPGLSGDWSLPRPRLSKAEIYLHTRRDTRWVEM